MVSTTSSAAQAQDELFAAHTLTFTNAPTTPYPITLTVRGTLPPWLHGVLYRTGPGTYTIPSSNAKGGEVKIDHWFDGLGINHRFAITGSDGTVQYSARKSSASLEAQISRLGKIPGITFGQRDPCQGIFRRYFTLFRRLAGASDGDGQTYKLPDGQNVQVTLSPDLPGFPTSQIPDSLKERKPKDGEGPGYLVAKTDASLLQLLDPQTLEPLAITTYKSFSPLLTGELSAAHGCKDPFTGEYFNFVCQVGPKPVYKVFSISADGTARVLADVKDAPLAYVHSLTMTERYVVLCIWAAEITYAGLSLLYNGNIAESITPTVSQPTTFYVIDRSKGGLVAKYITPPFFAFHYLNAYDEPATGDVLIDLAVYPDAAFINTLYVEEMRRGLQKQVQGRVRRFRLPNPKASGPQPPKCREATIDWTSDAAMELPTVAPSRYHRPYRWAYGMCKVGDGPGLSDALVKLDVGGQKPTALYWRGGPGEMPGEPIFVSRPSSTAGEKEDEDDGVVLSIVLDGLQRRSYLLVLDGKTMKEVARAEAPSGTWVGAGFHGVFV